MPTRHSMIKGKPYHSYRIGAYCYRDANREKDNADDSKRANHPQRGEERLPCFQPLLRKCSLCHGDIDVGVVLDTSTQNQNHSAYPWAACSVAFRSSRPRYQGSTCFHSSKEPLPQLQLCGTKMAGFCLATDLQDKSTNRTVISPYQRPPNARPRTNPFVPLKKRIVR